MELPERIVPNAYIQPVKISNKCGTDVDIIDVIAIGTGKTSLRRWVLNDFVLRHVYLTTIPSIVCENRLNRRHNETYSVICVDPNDGASVAPGDSGGPLIQRFDQSLIGITSFADDEVQEFPPRITIQVFTQIHSYFDWIQRVTGLEMPMCGNN